MIGYTTTWDVTAEWRELPSDDPKRNQIPPERAEGYGCLGWHTVPGPPLPADPDRPQH